MTIPQRQNSSVVLLRNSASPLKTCQVYSKKHKTLAQFTPQRRKVPLKQQSHATDPLTRRNEYGQIEVERYRKSRKISLNSTVEIRPRSPDTEPENLGSEDAGEKLGLPPISAELGDVRTILTSPFTPPPPKVEFSLINGTHSSVNCKILGTAFWRSQVIEILHGLCTQSRAWLVSHQEKVHYQTTSIDSIFFKELKRAHLRQTSGDMTQSGLFQRFLSHDNGYVLYKQIYYGQQGGFADKKQVGKKARKLKSFVVRADLPTTDLKEYLEHRLKYPAEEKTARGFMIECNRSINQSDKPEIRPAIQNQGNCFLSHPFCVLNNVHKTETLVVLGDKIPVTNSVTVIRQSRGASSTQHEVKLPQKVMVPAQDPHCHCRRDIALITLDFPAAPHQAYFLVFVANQVAAYHIDAPADKPDVVLTQFYQSVWGEENTATNDFGRTGTSNLVKFVCSKRNSIYFLLQQSHPKITASRPPRWETGGLYRYEIKMPSPEQLQWFRQSQVSIYESEFLAGLERTMDMRTEKTFLIEQELLVRKRTMMLKSAANIAKLRIEEKTEHIVHISRVIGHEMRACILTDRSVQIINVNKDWKNQVARTSHAFKFVYAGPPSLKIQPLDRIVTAAVQTSPVSYHLYCWSWHQLKELVMHLDHDDLLKICV